MKRIFRDVAGGDGGGGGGGGGWHGESRKSGLFQHAREKRRFMIATLAVRGYFFEEEEETPRRAIDFSSSSSSSTSRHCRCSGTLGYDDDENEDEDVVNG
uniref:Uncharacterized protein n=1 Tax=Vespula pensylvanica TaxID=30213 RepID=A0A834N4A3_VESPE|nr:hypothetical protein H0235_017024 [Vespula pensylvanica]